MIDNFETNPLTTVSSSNQAVASSAGGISEEYLQDPGAQVSSETEPFNRFFQETRGVLLNWSGGAEYAQSLGLADQDLRGTRVLSFRVAQQPKHANTIALGGPMTVSVELEDAAAKKSAVSVGILDTIPGIYTAQVDMLDLGLTDTTSAAFKTFRIPVAAFVTDGRDIDLGHVIKIRIRLAGPGDSPQGRISIDDLEVEK